MWEIRHTTLIAIFRLLWGISMELRGLPHPKSSQNTHHFSSYNLGRTETSSKGHITQQHAFSNSKVPFRPHCLSLRNSKPILPSILVSFACQSVSLCLNWETWVNNHVCHKSRHLVTISLILSKWEEQWLCRDKTACLVRKMYWDHISTKTEFILTWKAMQSIMKMK